MCVWFHSFSPCPASPSLTIDCDCSEKFSVTSCEFCNNENYEFKLIFPDLYCYLSQGILFAGHLVLRRPDLTEVLKFRPHKRHNQRGKETPKYTGLKPKRAATQYAPIISPHPPLTPQLASLWAAVSLLASCPSHFTFFIAKHAGHIFMRKPNPLPPSHPLRVVAKYACCNLMFPHSLAAPSGHTQVYCTFVFWAHSRCVSTFWLPRAHCVDFAQLSVCFSLSHLFFIIFFYILYIHISCFSLFLLTFLPLFEFLMKPRPSIHPSVCPLFLLLPPLTGLTDYLLNKLK